jgi:hypothetical protein
MIVFVAQALSQDFVIPNLMRLFASASATVRMLKVVVDACLWLHQILAIQHFAPSTSSLFYASYWFISCSMSKPRLRSLLELGVSMLNSD